MDHRPFIPRQVMATNAAMYAAVATTNMYVQSLVKSNHSYGCKL